jgi:hypothetical protein
MVGQVGHVGQVGQTAQKAHSPTTERAAPVPEVPRLLDVVALAIAYGTGPSVDDGDCGADGADLLVDVLRSAREDEAGALGARLWNRVRGPIARAVRVLGPTKPDAVRELAAQAAAVCGVCGLDWDRDFVTPAVVAIPEPKSWTKTPR